MLAPAADLPLAGWPVGALQEMNDWLAQESNAPPALVDDVDTRFRRLGRYAEALLLTALQHAACIELLAHHTPIHINTDKDNLPSRQTIGELDYIWRDRRNQQVWHWELAVKYYLYVPQASRARDTERFIGLQQRDTLLRKTTILRNKQLPLSARPEVAHLLGLRVDTAAAYVKGWLFYPLKGKRWDDYALAEPLTQTLLNRRHLRGWWLSHADFVKRLEQQADSDALRWRVLPRMQWLSPHQTDAAHTLDARALLTYLQAWFGLDTADHGPRPGLLAVALAPSVLTAPVYAPAAIPDAREAPDKDVTEPGSGAAAAGSGAGQPPATSPGQTYTEIHRGFVVADDWADAIR